MIDLQTSVTEYLDATAKIFPYKVAFADEREEITFSDLQTKAHRIATHLARKKIFREPVAIFMEKSVREIVTFLGAAYAGCFYTSIDVDMPAEPRFNLCKFVWFDRNYGYSCLFCD